MPRSKKWITTIDQRTPNNGGQRYGPYVSEMLFMTAAVEQAVREAGLLQVVHGNYQITVTKYTPEALERIQRISDDDD